MNIKNTIYSNFLFVFLFCLCFDNSFAQVDELAQGPDTTTTNDLLDLSIEDLMNMKVTLASKKAEKISDAPGMITSYSHKDIQRYGYFTLKDLASITSGYSTFSTFGETNLETRGQKAGSWEVNKHLLLIDGIPVNHSRANSAPLEYQVPVIGADRVEFLKGPGSALYGTSAFYGVMSITSLQLKENGVVADSRFSYGDAGQSKRILGNVALKNDMGQTNFSFSHFKKNFDGDSLGTPNTSFNFNNDNSTYINASFKFDESKFKGLGIGMIYMNRNTYAGEHWGTSPISPNNSENWEEIISYIKYKRDLSKKLTLNTYIKNNISTETGTYGATWNNFWVFYKSYLKDTTLSANAIPLSAFSYKTSDIEGLAEINLNINSSSSIIGGMNMFSRKELSSPNSFEWNISIPIDTLSLGTNTNYNFIKYKGSLRVNVASAYIQYQKTFDVLKGLILTSGGRFDNGFSSAGHYSQLSPRVGLVLKTTEKINFKALFGQALRTPGIREIQGNVAIIQEIKSDAENPNITNNISPVKAEIIKSIEVGTNYNTKLHNGSSNLSVSIAGFYNVTTNALDGKQFIYLKKSKEYGRPNIFVNSDGKINALGFEIDAQYVIHEKFRFMINHAFAKAQIKTVIKDKSGIDSTFKKSDFIDVPTHKTNFSSTYTLSNWFSLTAVVRQLWSYRVASYKLTPIKNENGEVMINKDGSVIYNQTGYNPKEVNGLKGDNFDILTGYTMIDLNLQIPLSHNIALEIQARNVLDTKWKQPSLLGQSSMIPLQRRNFIFTVHAKF